MIKDHDLRKEIDSELERPTSDQEWAWLDSQKILHRQRIGQLTAPAVAAVVQQARDAFSKPQSAAPLEALMTRDRGGEATPARVQAISDLVADQAAKDDRVISFRRLVLKNSLLGWGQVEVWIQERAKADGPQTRLLTVVLPQDAELTVRRGTILPKRKTAISERCPGIKSEVKVLRYALPGTTVVRTIPVAVDGVLNSLRTISEHLASRYGWQTAQATLFVLTGLAPLINPCRLEYSTKEIPALARVILTIDPALSPREVAERYREARKRFVGTRHRSMSQKHSTLVLFMNSRPAGETYAQSMAAWNKQFRKWRYRQVTNFGRDVQVARQRLLGAGPGKFRILEMVTERKEA